jgi:polyhydroxybutyrate depolymerase
MRPEATVPDDADRQGRSPADSQAGANGTHRMKVDGMERSFILDVPRRLERGAPLVLVFHGYTSSAEAIREEAGFTPLTEQHGFVAAYPQGTRDARGKAFFNVGYSFHDGHEVDDVTFVRQLVHRLAQDLEIDPRAVFSTGMSNGGDMSFFLAAQPEPFVQAIAPVAGTMMASWSKDFVPPRRISVLMVHGTRDTVTLWSGDLQNRAGWGAYLGVAAVADLWVRGLDLEISKTVAWPGRPEDERTTVRLHRWTTATDEAELRLYERSGGGHVWPKDLGARDRSTAAEIWSFFQAHLPPGHRGRAPGS